MSIKALSGKVFLIISGASRGIGRQIAISFSSVLEKGSQVLLLATNLNALKDTAKNMSPNVSTDTVSVDLGKATKDDLYDIVMQSLKDKDLQSFDRVVVVHNVGTMGDITKSTTDLTDFKEWHDYYHLNVFSPAVLNAVVMQIFAECTRTEKMVINISSLYSMKPKKLMASYCTGKAAREMFFKIFALENPHINVLNYSPGPVETNMFYEVCNEALDEETKTEFTDMLQKKTFLSCEQTINRLLQILTEQKYKSGDHIDYYDEL